MESVNIEKTLALPYTIKLVNEDDVFYAEVEEIPGCFSEGNTVELAYANIKDAMRLWMETAKERNIQIPVPKKEEEKDFSGRIMLRMPKELHKSLTKSADNDDISLNQFIVFLLSTNFAIHSVKQELQSFYKNQKIYEEKQTSNNWNIPSKQPYNAQITYPFFVNQR